MTLETKTSNPDLELEDFSSNSKMSKKTYVMTKHVTKKMSTSVTSSSSASGNTNEELSSLFNNDSSLLNITGNESTNKLMNFDLSPTMDFNMGLDMDKNLDMQSQLSSMMEKEINSTCQKMMGMSTKKVSKSSSVSASTSHDSLSSTSSSNQNNNNSSKHRISNSTKAIVPAENGTVNNSAGPFIVKIPLPQDISPENLEVSLSEEKNGLKMMTVTTTQEHTTQTENTKSKSSRIILKRFSVPSNANIDKMSSTFVCEGNTSILKIEAPIIVSQTPDIPIAIKFEDC